MATTTFVNGTVLQPDWLNDINATVYSGLATVGGAPSASIALFAPFGTGVVNRTVQTKLREYTSSADYNNTRGTDNYGFGVSAMDDIATPSIGGNATQNIGIGTNALTACTQGFANTALGHNALKTLTTPAYCTAVGAFALEDANKTDTVQLLCTAIGAYALNKNTNGQYNVAVGVYAGEKNTTGFFNTFIGQNSGQANITGESNTYVGHSAGQLNLGNRNTALGEKALPIATGSDDIIAIGYQALAVNLTGDQSIAIGTNTLATATVGPNLAIGYRAGEGMQTGVNNTFIGWQAAVAAVSSGSNTTAIGHGALQTLTSNSDNLAVGYNALNLSINGGSCAVGTRALDVQTNGGAHCAFGTDAGGNVTTGDNTLCLGNQAGTDAVRNITTGSHEIVVGNNNHTAAYIKVAWTVTSDQRDKTNIQDIQQGLDFIMKLKPKSFNLQNRETQLPTTGTRYGFLAQDILSLETTPIIINNDDSENLKMNEAMMIPVLVKALQELKMEFDSYKRSHP